jgi:hypothetical protein
MIGVMKRWDGLANKCITGNELGKRVKVFWKEMRKKMIYKANLVPLSSSWA